MHLFSNFSYEKVDFWKIFAPTASVGTAANINFDKKSVKMFIFFVEITKFFRAPSAREYMQVKIIWFRLKKESLSKMLNIFSD